MLTQGQRDENKNMVVKSQMVSPRGYDSAPRDSHPNLGYWQLNSLNVAERYHHLELKNASRPRTAHSSIPVAKREGFLGPQQVAPALIEHDWVSSSASNF